MSGYIRCKKCRETLISLDEKESITNSHGSVSSTEEEGRQVECMLDKTIIYLQEDKMPQWLEILVQSVSFILMSYKSHLKHFLIDNLLQSNWTKGKIVCPGTSCSARLGTFDFLSGQKCHCEGAILPPLRLTASKVDHLNVKS